MQNVIMIITVQDLPHEMGTCSLHADYDEVCGILLQYDVIAEKESSKSISISNEGPFIKLLG